MPSTTRILDANVNGTVYTTNANSALEAIDTCHSGATAPTNQVANGKLWLDTTTTPGILKVYNNATWERVHSGTVNIDAGAIDGTTVGATTATTGAFTSLTGNTLRGPGTSVAATPEISFANDTNTGLYRVGADTLGIATGGGLRVSVGTTDFVVTTGATITGNTTVAASIGVGTLTPDSKVDVDTGSASATAITCQAQAVTSAKLQMGLGMFSAGFPTVLGTANGLDLGTSSSAPVRFFVNSSEKARIDSSGNMLVGSSSFYAVANGRMKVICPSGGRGISVQLDALSNDAMNFVTGAGNMVGTISVSASATAYNTSSDYRLKENITPIQGASDIIKAMRPCTYTFKNDGSWADGFLAHELQELHPVAVTGSKDDMRDEEYEITPAVEATFDAEGVELTPAEDAVMGTRSVPDYQGVDYSKLTPILTAALQEALSKIDDLTARIEVLEAQ
jgi:hypothetical protein